MLSSLGITFKRNGLSKTEKFLAGKSANELIHSLKTRVAQKVFNKQVSNSLPELIVL